MKRFEVVHNIPSPYRLHLFDVLRQRLELRGYGFFLHLMARGHGNRGHWQSCADAVPVPHRFYSDVGPTWRGKEWHFNPMLIARLLASPPDVLMVGGPWDTPTGAGSTICGLRSHRIGWLESTKKNPGIVGGPIGASKRFLLARCDALALPGAEGVAQAKLILGPKELPTVGLLPNLVDERRFAPTSDPNLRRAIRERFGLTAERLALCVARLVPEKGLPEFFGGLDPALLEGWRLLLIGSGPMRSQVQACLDRFGPRAVMLDGAPYDEMPSFYQAADLFVLPSLKDRNPLSVVEALHSGLPLLLSDRVGNYPEALGETENGWGFDPRDAHATATAAESAFRSRPETLVEMGLASKKRAVRHWSSESAVDTFLDSVLPQ